MKPGSVTQIEHDLYANRPGIAERPCKCVHCQIRREVIDDCFRRLEREMTRVLGVVDAPEGMGAGHQGA